MQLPLPDNEVSRLGSLRSYRVLDTPPEQAFDDITHLAAYICGTPIALLGFIDRDRLWLKSRVGWDVAEVPRDMAFCSHTIMQSDVLIASDTLQDRGRLAECALATHGGVRFYAGATLLSPEGHALGTLCAMDSIPRGLTAGQIEGLRKLSRQAMSLLARRPASAREPGGPHDSNRFRVPTGEHFREVVECAADAVIEIDEQSRILFANQAVEQLFGYSREELIGSSLTMLMPEPLRQVHLDAIQRYLETGIKHVDWRAVEFPGVHRNGEQIPLDISIGETRHRDARAFIAVFRDIRLRKSMERERSRFASIVESSADAIIAQGLDGTITNWNRGAERIYGYSAEEIRGKHVAILAPQDLSEEMTSVLESVKRGECIEQYETIRMKKDGTRFHVSLSVSPVRDSTGIISGVLTVCRDITPQKQDQEALRRSEQRLQGIISSAMDAIITINRHQRIVVFNKAAEEIFRCSAAEGIGQPIDKFIPERFRVLHREHIEGFAKTGVTARSMYSPGTLFGVRADGKEFPIEATISQVESEGEKLYTVILRDISARLRMEAELRHAQKMEAVGQLAGGVAHEFNNYLGVILGYSELLAEDTAANEKLRRYLKEIKGATQHAASLTRQLLAFSRKQVPEPKLVDLNQIIWEAHNLLRRLVPANIEVVPALASTVGRVKIDSAQIQQILINLLVNARDAMPQGGKVFIETSDAELDETFASQHVGFRPGSYVLLSIRDTGTGIDTETRSHLFEPFYTTKEPGRGTGLGLSTVYGIVKQSGGHIRVESSEGKGTAFHIYLPRAEELLENSKTETPLAAESTGSATILIVEDEAPLRRLLSVSLEKRNHRVLTAKDGAEAFEIFRHQPEQIQVVVTDIMMPRMDGLELKQRITFLRPDVKFLFMSGYAEQVVEQHQASLKGCAFLEKPFLPEELAEKVSELLQSEAAA
jgi:PAS domain S-box-containing protein